MSEGSALVQQTGGHNPPFALINDLISTYTRMSGKPDESHRTVSWTIIQCPMALPFQRVRSFNSLKSFQGSLTIRANTNIFLWSISFHGATAPSGPTPPHYEGFTITLSHTTLGRILLGEWSARRNRSLPDKTWQLQETDVYNLGGFRTHDLSKRGAAYGRLRRRGHWDRLCDRTVHCIS
jgi:hypothetical protein